MKVKTQENVNKMVLRDLNQALSETFNDYQGSYFFGSRAKGVLNTDSDFDIVFLFNELNFAKKLCIAGIVGDIEYQYNIFIDYKLFTMAGTKSIEHIRRYVNPYFVHEAIDQGIFYGRQ
ncbi:MAG: nucleotidyltransferase domain-containing protein [Candidatus Vecturithrix sp.]|jgi:hypothetical protein|nr:nucleotidyltransferase domain-containing protein [Candidatus Vecturithrix sp.]